MPKYFRGWGDVFVGLGSNLCSEPLHPLKNPGTTVSLAQEVTKTDRCLESVDQSSQSGSSGQYENLSPKIRKRAIVEVMQCQ